MERMEEAIPEADHQALHHMLSESAWSERAVLDQVAQEANRLLGGHADSSLLIDECGSPKKGTQSVGVARQWCGQLGKVENGQVGVLAALSRGPDVTLIDARLFLPEAWTNTRCAVRRRFSPWPNGVSGAKPTWPWRWSPTPGSRASAWPGWALTASTVAIRPSCAPLRIEGRLSWGTCIRTSGLT